MEKIDFSYFLESNFHLLYFVLLLAFSAASAPVSVKTPPGFKNRELIAADIVDDHTLCFHINSEFFAKSLLAFPPAHPPDTKLKMDS